MAAKRRLLILSHILPLAPKSGQEQRVRYMVRAARERFHVTFLTSVAADRREAVASELAGLCDETIVLPAVARSVFSRAAGGWYAVRTGLKTSNYVISRLDLTPARVREAIGSREFDAALFEYWHAAESASVFKARSIPCLLDMHNVLWQAYDRELQHESKTPRWWRERALSRYRSAEERSWTEFDGVIAINEAERKYTASRVPASVRMFYAPMGIDLSLWPFTPQPADPPRLAYYGGLKSRHNEKAALECFYEIMPAVWKDHPETELWLIGSNPSEAVQALAGHPKVRVTGYVPEVHPVLATMRAVLCPWSGTYGFRSRLIEVMATGVPVVATHDAVYGMDLTPEQGLLFGKDTAALAGQALRLLADSAFSSAQSRLARAQVERQYSFESSYGRLAGEIDEWVASIHEGRCLLA